MNSAMYLFRPRFPVFSLIFGALLLSKGWVFLGALLLAFAVTRVIRWRRGTVEAPAGFHMYVRRGGVREARPFEDGGGVDEARVAAAEWRDARVER